MRHGGIFDDFGLLEGCVEVHFVLKFTVAYRCAVVFSASIIVSQSLTFCELICEE